MLRKKVSKVLKKKRVRNPKIESSLELDDLLNKKVKLIVSYGKHKSGGSVYGILELAPYQENMYTVTSKENTPRNKEGAYFYFNEKDVTFAGNLFNSSYPEIFVS